MEAWEGDIEVKAVRHLKKKFPLAFGWKIFPIPHMDNDSQLIQQQPIIKTLNFYVENPSMRREKPRDLV